MLMSFGEVVLGSSYVSFLFSCVDFAISLAQNNWITSMYGMLCLGYKREEVLGGV